MLCLNGSEIALFERARAAIATDYELHAQGSIPGKGKRFFITRLALGATTEKERNKRERSNTKTIKVN
jgi:hypothetical protein